MAARILKWEMKQEYRMKLLLDLYPHRRSSQGVLQQPVLVPQHSFHHLRRHRMQPRLEGLKMEGIVLVGSEDAVTEASVSSKKLDDHEKLHEMAIPVQCGWYHNIDISRVHFPVNRRQISESELP